MVLAVLVAVWRLLVVCRMAGGCWAFWVPERQGGRAAAGAGGAVGGGHVSGGDGLPGVAGRW